MNTTQHIFSRFAALVDLIDLFRIYPHHFDAFFRRTLDSAFPLLRQLAYIYRAWIIPRKRFIIVIGSLGKTTTTRALRSAILEKDHYQSFSNYGSRLAENILRSRPGEPHDVFEVGISQPGEMTWPARMLKPDVVVATSIKSDHNRSFLNFKETRKEKVKMVRALRQTGLAVLNGDDPNVLWMATQTDAKVVTYGFGSENDIRASDYKLNWPEGSIFTIHINGETRLFRSRLIGKQMVYPILAAVAVAWKEGFPIDEIFRQLESLSPTKGRMQPILLDGGASVLDDAFKSNQEASQAALDCFAILPAKRRIVVIGDISDPPKPHGPVYRDLGRQIGTFADLLVVVSGKTNFRRIRTGARRANMAEQAIITTSSSIQSTTEMLRTILVAGDVVLLLGRAQHKYRRILLGLLGTEVRCRARYCNVKIFYCEDCPLLRMDTTKIRNRFINQLLRH